MALKTVSAKIPRFQLPEKFKGTIVERWAKYWKGLASDYKDVAIDSVKTVRENPVRYSVYASLGALVYGCCKTNPDQQMFVEQFRKSEHLVALVPEDSQNPSTVNYLKMLERSRNNDSLRITSLGPFSIMWLDNCAGSLSTYDATCEYLKPELRTFHERIIDIGLWNNWWNLEKQMKNYDVNF